MNSIEIYVPDVGTEDAVEVIELLVDVGDSIAIDDPIIVLESDKASIEVPATSAGVIDAIKVKVGDQVKQGDTLISVSAESSDEPESGEQKEDVKEEPIAEIQEAAPEQNVPKAVSESTTTEVIVPDLGGADEVEVIELCAGVGTNLSADDAIIVLESDKASMDIPCPVAGEILDFKVSLGDKVKEGDVIALIKTQATSEPENNATPPLKEQNAKTSTSEAKSVKPSSQTNSSVPSSAMQPHEQNDSVHAGPAVRKLARELGVYLDRVSPTGPRGRIQKDDLNAYIKAQVQAAQNGIVSSGPVQPELPDFVKFGEVEIRKLEKLHALTAKNMQSSWNNVPHVTQFDEADITELETFRKSKKDAAAAKGLKLTPLPFMIKACAHALKDLPQFNVSLDMANNQIIQKHYYNIGIAVDTSYGLVVPVIKDVLHKDLWEIAAELGELAEKAKARKLSPADMQGACFTISSLGSVGGTAFTPIVNQPEVAILGVSKAQMKPIYSNGEFHPRLMLPLSLSYDHRAVNGADAARFSGVIAKYLSDIRELLL